MATKRRLNRIRLDKIAAVDLPCQEPAVAVFTKRAPAPGEVPPAIVKKTFTEALTAQLVSEKVSDTFWRAFENQWAVKEAFRTALTDEIADGGDGSEATTGFVQAMEELASSAAEAARDAASTADTDLEAAVEDAVSKWLQHQEQPMNITDKAGLKKAVASFNASTSPFGHVAIIQKAAADLGAEDELPAEGPLAKAQAPVSPDEFAKVKRELAITKLSPEGRSYFDGLDEAGQTEFLAKSETDQASAIAKANEADPVVYTTADGTELRKSAGATVIALAKRVDGLEKDNAELRKGVTVTTLEKRAADDFPNVAKSVAVDMLTSVEQVGANSDTGKSIMKSLTALNAQGAGHFSKRGTTEVVEVPETIEKARQDFDTEVAKVKREDGISLADAMTKVRRERPDLFEAAYPENAEDGEAA